MRPRGDRGDRGDRRDRGDRGNAIVEFALWLPMTIVALAACLQFGQMIFDQRAATEAARLAARAQEQGADPVTAARAALSGRGQEAVVTARGGTVTVQLPVRQFLPWLPGPFTTTEGSSS